MTARNSVEQSSIQSTFAPVFAIKASASQLTPDSGLLTSRERQQAWDRLLVALPAVMTQCSGFGSHPDDQGYPGPKLIWDFLNGRLLKISINKRGGYDLAVETDKLCRTETQLPLELLLLKLLALDYTPEEFRRLMG